MIYNINYYRSLSNKNYGEVLGVVNLVSKKFIIIRIILDAIFVSIIMNAIYDTGILDKRLNAILAFLFAFNSAELMTNIILAQFIKKKVEAILNSGSV